MLKASCGHSTRTELTGVAKKKRLVVDKYRNMPLNKVIRALGWQRWKLLTKDEREIYCIEAEAKLEKNGKQVAPTIQDHDTLLQVAQSGFGLQPKIPKKFGKGRLAKIGKAFLGVAKTIMGKKGKEAQIAQNRCGG